MRRNGILLAYTLALACMGHAPAASAVLTLDPKAVAAAQIRTTRVEAAPTAPPIAAYGWVLDPAPLAGLAGQLASAGSEVAAARARLALAKSAARRAEALYRADHNVSMATLQNAQAALDVAAARLRGAATQLAMLRAQARATWGARLAHALDAGISPLPQLSSGATLLVRVSLPLGQTSQHPAQAEATTPDGARMALEFFSPAPQAARGTAGQSFFYLAQGAAELPTETPLTVDLPAAPNRLGVVIPASAVVWQDGEALVYRDLGHGVFAPFPLPALVRTAGGYFVPQQGALVPGARIVSQGAALLLSASQAAKAGRAAAGDRD